MPANNDELDLGSHIDFLKSKSRKLFVTGLVLGVLGVIYMLVIPAIYTYRSSLLIVGDATQQASALQALVPGTGPTPLDIMEGVATSNTCLERVAKANKIGSVKDLKTILTFTKDYPKNRLMLAANDPEAKRSIKILNDTVDSLRLMNKTVAFSAADLQAKFIEDSIKEKTVQLETAQGKLAEYLKTMKAPSDPTDVGSVSTNMQKARDYQFQLASVEKQLKEARAAAERASASGIDIPTTSATSANWRNRIKELELQLRTSETQYGPKNTVVVKARAALEEAKTMAAQETGAEQRSIDEGLNSTVAALEQQRLLLTFQVAETRQLANLAPDEAMALGRLYTEAKTLEQVLLGLRQRYETAKVDAQVQRVTWTVLETPYREDEPGNKRPVMAGVVLFMLGFIGAGVWEYIKRTRETKRTAKLGLK